MKWVGNHETKPAATLKMLWMFDYTPLAAALWK